jgi:hypothetical protein
MRFLTVQLRTEKDSAFVTGRLTDEKGAFTIAGLVKGVYLIEARVIGFQPLRERVRIGELSAFLDLGTLQMQEVSTRLGEVVVSSTADGVSSTMDRKTFTVADNASQAGGSVLQAMSNLPGVTIGQDGKLQLRGSDKVAVLIDGKQTALTGYGSQTGLDNLPASALERIEIINNPSSRYDANASAGVINLVFRKQEQEGFNGKVGVIGGAGALWEKRENLPTIRPQYRGTPKFNPSAAINYRSGATNEFMQGDWLYAPTLNRNEFSTRRHDDGTVIEQQVKRNRRTDYATLKAGVDHGSAPTDRHQHRRAWLQGLACQTSRRPAPPRHSRAGSREQQDASMLPGTVRRAARVAARCGTVGASEGLTESGRAGRAVGLPEPSPISPASGWPSRRGSARRARAPP